MKALEKELKGRGRLHRDGQGKPIRINGHWQLSTQIDDERIIQTYLSRYGLEIV